MFYKIVCFFIRIIVWIFYPVQVVGDRSLSQYQGAVLCPNHAHWIDPIFISVMLKRQVHWMAKKELFKNPILSKIFHALGVIPVGRQENDIQAIKNSLKILKRGEILGIFMEGTRVTDYNPENAKGGAVMMGDKANVPFIPIFIDSTYRVFSRSKIIVGDALSFKKEDGSKLTHEDYQNNSRELLEKIYSLKNVDLGCRK